MNTRSSQIFASENLAAKSEYLARERLHQKKPKRSFQPCPSSHDKSRDQTRAPSPQRPNAAHYAPSWNGSHRVPLRLSLKRVRIFVRENWCIDIWSSCGQSSCSPDYRPIQAPCRKSHLPPSVRWRSAVLVCPSGRSPQSRSFVRAPAGTPMITVQYCIGAKSHTMVDSRSNEMSGVVVTMCLKSHSHRRFTRISSFKVILVSLPNPGLVHTGEDKSRQHK